jgi:hypothetical protein
MVSEGALSEHGHMPGVLQLDGQKATESTRGEQVGGGFGESQPNLEERDAG